MTSIIEVDFTYKRFKEGSQSSLSVALDRFILDMEIIRQQVKTENLLMLESDREILLKVWGYTSLIASRSEDFRRQIKNTPRTKRDKSIPEVDLSPFEYTSYKTNRSSFRSETEVKLQQNRLRLQKVLSTIITRKESLLAATDLVTARELSLMLSRECDEMFKRLCDLEKFNV